MDGGGDAQKGLNLLKRRLPPTTDVADEGTNGARKRARHEKSFNGDSSFHVVNVGGKNTMHVSPGDRLVIHTPGGGGYGVPGSSDTAEFEQRASAKTRASGSLMDYTSLQESA